MKKCVFCGAEFETDADFKLHMANFGYNKEKHLQKLEDIHRRGERERPD